MSLNVGDCLLLGRYFYCLTDVDAGEAATLVLSFERDGVDRLLRVK